MRPSPLAQASRSPAGSTATLLQVSESISIPKNVRDVVGPSVFSSATGNPRLEQICRVAADINPRRACARVTVLGLCVCVCVSVCPACTTSPATTRNGASNRRYLPTASAQSGKHFKYILINAPATWHSKTASYYM